MGRFEKEMAAAFCTSALDTIFADVGALLELRKKYDGGETVPVEHLRNLSKVLGNLNSHTAEWIDNFNRVLEEAKSEGIHEGSGTSSSVALEEPRPCPVCKGAGLFMPAYGCAMYCETCKGTGRAS